MGIGDLKGPLLIDSLDHPNPSNHNTQPQVIKKTNKDYVTLVIIILLGVLPMAFGSFLIFYFIQDTNPVIEFVRWVFLLAFPLGTTALLVGVCVYSVSWLHGWASKNKLVSLNEGPWHNADIRITTEVYELMFGDMMKRYFDAMNERASQSMYSGVSTLTIDQSTKSSTTTNQKDQQAVQTTEPTKNDGNGAVFDLNALKFLDYVNSGQK